VFTSLYKYEVDILRLNVDHSNKILCVVVPQSGVFGHPAVYVIEQQNSKLIIDPTHTLPYQINMSNLVDWAKRIITEYESGATGCFLLHGNINDQFVMPLKEGPKLGRLQDFLIKILLPRFDVVFTYDLGYGIRVEKGRETFDKWPGKDQARALSGTALPAIRSLGQYLLYTRNLSALGEKAPKVAVILKQSHLIVPAIPNALNYELNSLASVIRSWASDVSLQEHGQVAFILTDGIHNLHPLVTQNPRVSSISIPLPESQELEHALEILQPDCKKALTNFEDNLTLPAERLKGATISAVENLLKQRHHAKKSLRDDDLSELKKQLVEAECEGLIGFVEPKRDLSDYLGMPDVLEWLRNDLNLWEKGYTQALPMGYLFSGPVGTGKTFLAECLAGEAGVPVVTLKNFRDRWVGSTEANLEKIFSLLHALGKCIVFVDEADQALGRRAAGSGDSGVSSRVYSMLAKEMSDTDNRGKLLWILASSRPDLIEVDLKRPGRIDVKIPIFPAISKKDGLSLLLALCKRRGLNMKGIDRKALLESIPELLTPGAAEALSVKAFRLFKLGKLEAHEAIMKILEDYRPAVSPAIIRHQMNLAAEESTEKKFIPDEVLPYISLS